jgi:hypothetical protein
LVGELKKEEEKEGLARAQQISGIDIIDPKK